MADKNALMRPLTSASLKPRPSTQAVWEPRRAEPEPLPAADPVLETPVPADPEPAAIPEAEAEPVWEPVQETPAAPSPVPEMEELPVQKEEPLQEEEQPAEEKEEEIPQEEPSLPSYAETVSTFAPAVSAQWEEEYAAPEEPEPERKPDSWDVPPEEEEEEPFDLDAVIASILADDDDEDDEEDHPAAQDALPTEEMPEPAAVPLYGETKPRPRRKGWIWLIGAALIVAAAGYAARRCGWLN